MLFADFTPATPDLALVFLFDVRLGEDVFLWVSHFRNRYIFTISISSYEILSRNDSSVPPNLDGELFVDLVGDDC